MRRMPGVNIGGSLLHLVSYPILGRTAGLALLPLALLAGCAPAQTAPTPTENYDAGPTPTPEPSVTAEPIGDDAVLVIRATATDAAGAALELQYQVRLPSPWDYEGTQNLPLGLIQDCAGELDDSRIAAEQWSFTRGNLTAIPVDPETEWGGSTIAVEPTAGSGYVAGRLILATPADSGSVPCHTDKSFSTLGAGALAIGSPGDAASRTAWAGLQWGFRTTDATLSDCSFELTELGKQYGAGAGWVEKVDASTCVVGP